MKWAKVMAANLAARNAAPVLGSYVCNDVTAARCPDRCGCPLAVPSDDRHCWHESTRRRLEWQGGPSKGAAADLAAWTRLGGHV